MYMGGLRRIVHDGLFVPRDTSNGAKIVDLQSGAFVVPLDYGCYSERLEKELIELFIKYHLLEEGKEIETI